MGEKRHLYDSIQARSGPSRDRVPRRRGGSRRRPAHQPRAGRVHRRVGQSGNLTNPTAITKAHARGEGRLGPRGTPQSAGRQGKLDKLDTLKKEAHVGRGVDQAPEARQHRRAPVANLTNLTPKKKAALPPRPMTLTVISLRWPAEKEAGGLAPVRGGRSLGTDGTEPAAAAAPDSAWRAGASTQNASGSW
jgi:hypothetical protein